MRIFLMFVVLVILWTSDVARAQEKQKLLMPRHLSGGGVADPAGKTGFFPNTSGGIDAIELATGKVLWSSKDAHRPLLATDDRLFVQAGKSNTVRVLALDTSKEGKRVLESPPIALADWVSVEVAYGRSFRSGVRADDKHVWLSWEARAFYAGGARPPPEVEKRARKVASGVARVDLETGKVQALTEEQITAGKFLPVPGEAVNPKVGELMLVLKDGQAKNAKTPFEKRRTLQALSEAKEVVWHLDIAAPILLPPKP